MSEMPRTNASVPFHFCLRAKKATVLVVPIMSVRPIMKRIWRVYQNLVCATWMNVGVGDVTFPMANLGYGVSWIH